MIDWIGGAKLIVKSGDTGLTGNVYSGLHEFEDMAFLIHFLCEKDLFVDVGANLGSYSILAGSVCRASVIAFEPIPEAFERLCNNIRFNGLEERAEALNFGVGESEGVLNFTSNLDTVNHAIPSDQSVKNSIEIPVVTLDRILGMRSPSAMKIDVEGFELPVLKGGAEVLENRSLNAVILELNQSGLRYGYRDTDLVGLMASHGFVPYSYSPFERSLRKLNGKNKGGGNTLFLRDASLVEKRIQASGKFEVFGQSV